MEHTMQPDPFSTENRNKVNFSLTYLTMRFF